MTDRDTFAAAALTGLLAFCICGCASHLPAPQPKASTKVVTVCSGCGTEWWAQGEKPPKPITKCPNCPMSKEEFEALIESLRKQREAAK